MIKSKNKNYKYFLLLFLIVSVVIYFICLVADFLIHRLDLWQMRDRNKIFYEMKTSARDEGFKSTNFKPVLWPKLELSEIHKDQIVHVAAQPYEKVFITNAFIIELFPDIPKLYAIIFLLYFLNFSGIVLLSPTQRPCVKESPINIIFVWSLKSILSHTASLFLKPNRSFLNLISP